jgi:ubiquinone/menaquinone biosynthesis C-methylase UbiE
MTICDLGCGNGFYTIPLAQLTGSEGRVYAVDIQSEMLEMLVERAREAKVDNIKPVLGTAIDPKLPDGGIDLILLVDVYHEISHPEPMLAAMKRSLSPAGRIALVEFRAEDPDVPIKPLHKMTKAQMRKEFTHSGFEVAQEFDDLPWQHVMWFRAAGVEDAAEPH